jgi:hypothetical protein
MDPKRKKMQDQWLILLKELGAEKDQIDMCTEKFASLSDDEFKSLVREYRENNITFPLLTFNMEKKENKVDHEQVMEVGRKYGVVWFEKLALTDAITNETSITPNEYLILECPLRRLMQHLYKKRSTGENEYVKDRLTGQVTGDSKSSSISKVELGILAAKGLDEAALEAIKVRGGDDEAYNNMVEQIILNGEASLDPILAGDTKPTSINTMNAWFAGMMLKSSL